jgi:hypothetical protein
MPEKQQRATTKLVKLASLSSSRPLDLSTDEDVRLLADVFVEAVVGELI